MTTLLVACVFICTPALAEHRVALVIGNSSYTQVAKLTNPRNDASDIADALQELGFDVFQGTDLTSSGFNRILTKFARALRTADVALLFYAGHGVQIGGINYLIPVDTQVSSVQDITQNSISLKKIQKMMRHRPRIALLFFDACRNDPFLRKLSRSLDGRAAQVRPNWAEVAAPTGTYVAFATAAGETAADGTGRNSPFTRALLRHIGTPGMDAQIMMRKVRDDVAEATKQLQVVWEKSSLSYDNSFFFAPARATASSPAMERSAFKISASKARYRRNGKVRLTITTPKDCRLTLISTDTKGQSCLLFPHPKLPDNVLRAGSAFKFPPKGAMRLPDAGEETFIAMCNTSPAALIAGRRTPPRVLCSKGGPDSNVNDKLFEVATYDPDESGVTPTTNSAVPKEKQQMLRDSVTVLVE